MQIKTTDLDRLKGTALAHGVHAELWTLSPGQTTAPGTLVLVGDAKELATITSEGLRTEPARALEFTFGARKPGSIELVVRARGTGRVIIYAGKEAVGVVTIGDHVSHLGSEAVDLIAQVSNGRDVRKVVALQQILHSQETSIIDQRTGPYGDKHRLACGSVVDRAGTTLFGTVDYSARSYHKLIKPGSGFGDMPWDNIQYDPLVTQTALTKIKALLNSGTAVRVGAVYHPVWTMLAPNGALQADRAGGHSILIVGYAENRFLYLDPFPGMSRTRYSGGFDFNRKSRCEYMGILEINPVRGIHLAAKVAGTPLAPKADYMSVISGPLH